LRAGLEIKVVLGRLLLRSHQVLIACTIRYGYRHHN
jgi:hypothetical protein